MESFELNMITKKKPKEIFSTENNIKTNGNVLRLTSYSEHKFTLKIEDKQKKNYSPFANGSELYLAGV